MRWRGRRIVPIWALALGTLTLALNGLAYSHAYRFTHLADRGRPTPRPEALSPGEKLRALLAGPVVPKRRNRTTPAASGLSFRTQVLAAADGAALEAWLLQRPGSRGIVAAFHGYAGAKDSLLPHARAFLETGYDVLLVDFRGSGGSAGQRTSLGFHEAGDVAAAFRHARSLTGGPVVLYGESMGAAAILKAAADGAVHPDGAILECPFDRLLTTVEHRFETYGVPAFPAARLLLFWGGVQQGFDALDHDPVDYARRVTAPTLLMSGADDPWVREAETRGIFAALGGPKQLVLFPGAGHGSCRTRRPWQWRAAVSAFLHRVGA